MLIADISFANNNSIALLNLDFSRVYILHILYSIWTKVFLLPYKWSVLMFVTLKYLFLKGDWKVGKLSQLLYSQGLSL